jgi:hypothetical protein
LAELEAALVKAEKTMNQLKCKIAEECQVVRCAHGLENLCISSMPRSQI